MPQKNLRRRTDECAGRDRLGSLERGWRPHDEQEEAGEGPYEQDSSIPDRAFLILSPKFGEAFRVDQGSVKSEPVVQNGDMQQIGIRPRAFSRRKIVEEQTEKI